MAIGPDNRPASASVGSCCFLHFLPNTKMTLAVCFSRLLLVLMLKFACQPSQIKTENGSFFMQTELPEICAANHSADPVNKLHGDITSENTRTLFGRCRNGTEPYMELIYSKTRGIPDSPKYGSLMLVNDWQNSLYVNEAA